MVMVSGLKILNVNNKLHNQNPIVRIGTRHLTFEFTIEFTSVSFFAGQRL